MSLTFYKITFPSGHFYVGSTTADNINYYLKGKYRYLCKAYPELAFESFSSEEIETEIINNQFSSEQELRNFEHQEIKKYIHQNPLCLNQNLETNCTKQAGELHICPDCGGKMGRHKKSCHLCRRCDECNAPEGYHLKSCSKHRLPKSCPECGSLYGKHKDFCSHSKGKCKYCGYSLQSHRHAKDCFLYKKPNFSKKICEDCGGLGGQHKKTCSKFKAIKPCSECGGLDGKHRKTCSQYKRRKERI